MKQISQRLGKSKMPLKAYLAGPDVFIKDAVKVLERKRELCAEYGLEALIPLDNEIDADCADAAQQICDANIEMIRSSKLVIANLSPFRGPHADPGTTLEIGLAHALGIPVYGYSNDERELIQRMGQDFSSMAAMSPMAKHRDEAIEDFGLHDNLMLEGICSKPLVAVHDPSDLSALKAFEKLLGSIEF